jgi:membrane protease YdiL (CAAX protease family)
MLEPAIAAAAMCLFAAFAHSGWPLFALSVAGLVTAAAVLARFFRIESRPAAVLGLDRVSPRVGLHAGIGIALGIALGAIYRAAYGHGLFPGRLTGFALTAALIGAAEELLYRGYAQGRARRFGAGGAVAFAALAHTAYKCALFVYPPQGYEVSLGPLAVWTLLGGAVFGILREISSSAVPPLAAHACFDLIAYGDRIQAPWWVWS